jgi:hypothetical protein
MMELIHFTSEQSNDMNPRPLQQTEISRNTINIGMIRSIVKLNEARKTPNEICNPERNR